MANYLVTGAAGFIGARVTEMLLDAGHTVLGVDNLNDAYDTRMKQWRLERLLENPSFHFDRLDISRREEVERISALGSKPSIQLDAVINLAARAGVRQSVLDPWVYFETNLTGTLNLLELCRRQGIPKFILASTSSIYGSDAPLPTPEEASSDFPLQPYAASKKGAEALCYSYHHLYDIDVTVFRYFTVYGPAGRPDMSMFRFTQWINEGLPLHLYGDGEQSRGFTYVDDIARGTILGLQPQGYQIINLGGHETIKINDLIRLLEERIGKKAHIERHPPIAADMLASWADVQKAGRLLGWEPQVALRQGVERLVEWYAQERGWASQIATT
ncbi:MAG: nucleotide sugar epimerase [Anaerolineae bacterium UTCFX2]|jgi:nucleoside-diphosphate-sugar epimerase|nr:SDR family NAD(P)-dependent oxidoreductase [Anaerolineales bacterium]OQY91855.1 MAG: nucleotide sugar epimerase [Anaerolineae bacterium UTCFX2]